MRTPASMTGAFADSAGDPGSIGEHGRGPVLESVLTCPFCGVATRATMPTNACQYFYDCPACGTVFRPKPGDCCVFCSYGSVPCPSKQRENRDSQR